MKWIEIPYEEAQYRYMVGDLVVGVYRGVYGNDFMYQEKISQAKYGGVLLHGLKELVKEEDDNLHYSFRFYREVE